MNLPEWAEAAAAVKTSLDTLGSAFRLLKDFRSSGKPTAPEEAVIDRALADAEHASQVAQAQMAKALGYQLCHCTFPPTAMLTVGQLSPFGGRKVGPVYECAKCGYNSAGPYSYDRFAPPRSAAGT